MYLKRTLHYLTEVTYVPAEFATHCGWTNPRSWSSLLSFFAFKPEFERLALLPEGAFRHILVVLKWKGGASKWRGGVCVRTHAWPVPFEEWECEIQPVTLKQQPYCFLPHLKKTCLVKFILAGTLHLRVTSWQTTSWHEHLNFLFLLWRSRIYLWKLAYCMFFY